jgi:hypothetical protein
MVAVIPEQWGRYDRFAESAAFRHMAKSRKHPPEDAPFPDEFFEWMGSTEGQAHIEMSDALWPLLQDVKLDASQRVFVWPDESRLTFDKSARRLQKQVSNFKLPDVKEFLIDWIDNYAPDSMTQEQLDEFDSLASAWSDELRE